MTMLTRIAVVILSIIMMSRGNSLIENYQLCNLQFTNEEGAPVSLNIGVLECSSTGVQRKLTESDEKYRQLQLQMAKLNVSKSDREFQQHIAELERKNSKLEETVENSRSNIAELERKNSKLEETLLETRDVLKKMGTSGNIDCKNLLDAGNTVDGVYTIIVDWSLVQVLCDMVGGGWTVFQHRFNGSVDFRRNFQSYTRGFGDPNSEFWLGLENIHKMTSNGQWMLQINLENFHGETAYAQYNDFKVRNGSRYELAIGAYSGTAGDELSYNNGAAFSTYDMDQYPNQHNNCAADDSEGGAWWWWWYCLSVNLNSDHYYNTTLHSGTIQQGMIWYSFKGLASSGTDRFMKMAMMKMMKV